MLKSILKSLNTPQGSSSVEEAQIVPKGVLLQLDVSQVFPHASNPRHLFDPEPLKELKQNIREHGVLVPITVYQAKGQSTYTILDGARRHRCCVELKEEGVEVPPIPANLVDPPTKIAGLLYMFSIHNFREGWELMPTALGLRNVMEDLDVTDDKALNKLTGLSLPQIERCKKLLAFPERFQNMSLDPKPETRIPSNFWIEALPVIDLSERELPDLASEHGRDGITDILVEKYRRGAIKSVIHFRKIMESHEYAKTTEAKAIAIQRLREFLLDINYETRKAFDELAEDNRRIHTAVRTCDDFIRQIERLKLDYVVDSAELRQALEGVKSYAEQLLEKLRFDPPPSENATEAEV